MRMTQVFPDAWHVPVGSVGPTPEHLRPEGEQGREALVLADVPADEGGA